MEQLELKQAALELGLRLAWIELAQDTALNTNANIEFNLTPGSEVSLGGTLNTALVRQAIANAVQSLMLAPSNIVVTPIQIQTATGPKTLVYLGARYVNVEQGLVRLKFFDAELK